MSVRMISTFTLVLSLLLTAGCSITPQVKIDQPYWSTCMAKGGAVMGIPGAAYGMATGGAAFVAGAIIGGTACAGLDQEENPVFGMPGAEGMMVVHFDLNASDLGADDQEKLITVLDSFSDEDTITVVGHTCDIGTPEYNQKLSERRADAVKKYLMKLGIPEDHIEISGAGEERPVNSNETDNMRQENRRAEISLIKQ